MGTSTRVICLNPNNIEAFLLQEKMVEQYGEFRVKIENTDNPSELEVSCTVFVEEEQFLQILQTLKEMHEIEELRRIWWFGEIVKV